MKVDERAKKCVAFLQYKMQDGTFRYAGTCFFVSKEMEENKYRYIVTAKHVIEGIKKLCLTEIYVRLNFESGLSEAVVIDINKWIYHENVSVDIAISGFYFSDKHAHTYFGDSLFLNNDSITSNEIDCGDEVFITGLFSHHTGIEKNLPIVRIGNIAMMPVEKIRTQMGLMDAYLVESRSIGGLSGSPVFINLGSVRRLGGEIKHAQGDMIPPLLGLIHGHFDVDGDDIDSIMDKNTDNEKINVGIAIVTPIIKLNELLQSKQVRDYEKQVTFN